MLLDGALRRLPDAAAAVPRGVRVAAQAAPGGCGAAVGGVGLGAAAAACTALAAEPTAVAEAPAVAALPGPGDPRPDPHGQVAAEDAGREGFAAEPEADQGVDLPSDFAAESLDLADALRFQFVED